MRVRIESFKGKKYVVARDNKGRFIETRKITRKDTASTIIQRFKDQGSFNKDKRRVSLTNVKETTDFSRRPKIPKKAIKVQGVAQAAVNGKLIIVRSDAKTMPFDIEKLKEEALERLYALINEQITEGADYDSDEGKKYADSNKIKISIGVVYYTGK